MQKIIFIESLTKEYLIMQRKLKKKAAAFEFLKLGIVIMSFITLAGWYAHTVTSGSTMGYNLKQSENLHKQNQQKLSVVKYQISKNEQVVFNKTKEILLNQSYGIDRQPVKLTIEDTEKNQIIQSINALD